MDGPLLLLPLLALADSTSVGTLIIPVLLMLAPGRVPAARIAAYLAAVAAIYLLVGIALLGVADAAVAALQSPQGEVAGIALEAVLGLALVGYAAWPKRWRRQSGSPGRLEAWRERALTPGAPLRPLLLLALLAVAVEIATMLPYVGAIALLARSQAAAGTPVVLLSGYCVLMITPALVLLLLRRVGARRLDPLLQRVHSWSKRSAGSPFVRAGAGVVGVALVVDAVLRA